MKKTLPYGQFQRFSLERFKKIYHTDGCVRYSIKETDNQVDLIFCIRLYLTNVHFWPKRPLIHKHHDAEETWNSAPDENYNPRYSTVQDKTVASVHMTDTQVLYHKCVTCTQLGCGAIISESYRNCTMPRLQNKQKSPPCT